MKDAGEARAVSIAQTNRPASTRVGVDSNRMRLTE